jgi:predicted ATPase
MKIQLQSLRVVNCGPLRDVCIHFNTKGESPVTVLAGANGSGKTTVLKLIVALMRMLPARTFHDGFSEEHPQAVLKHTDYAQADLFVDGQLVSLFSGASTDANVLPENNAGMVQVGLAQETRANGRLVEEIGKIINAQEGEQLPFISEHALPQNAKTWPSLLYFPFIRYLVPISGNQIQREDDKYQWIYRYETAHSFKGSLDSYLIWLDYAEQEIYAQVIDFLNGLDFDGKKFGVRRKELRAIVTTRDGQTHGVAELSSGEQNILIMLLELRRRLLPYSIVLIDEIENSLHPAFQHRLGQALRKMQATIPFQLILTTHASDFARIFGPDSVRILTEF